MKNTAIVCLILFTAFLIITEPPVPEPDINREPLRGDYNWETHEFKPWSNQDSVVITKTVESTQYFNSSQVSSPRWIKEPDYIKEIRHKNIKNQNNPPYVTEDEVRDIIRNEYGD